MRCLSIRIDRVGEHLLDSIGVKVRYFFPYRTSYLAHSFHSTHIQTYGDIHKYHVVRLAPGPNASLRTGIASNVIQPWASEREEKHRMKEISVTRAYLGILQLLTRTFRAASKKQS
jgi:hypothetical protein